MSQLSTSLDPSAPATQVAHTFPAGALTTDQLCQAYRSLWLIRRVEVALNRLYGGYTKFPSGSPVRFAGDEPINGLTSNAEMQLSGAMHTAIGHEAIAVGAALALRPTDLLTCTYRGHHHALARGLDPSVAIAEVLGKATGFAKGKGGSMHFIQPAFGLMGANGIVGAQVPHAAGIALTSWIRGTDTLAISFFGDGAMFQGIMHETFNIAQQWQLPVIFFCENNRMAEMTEIRHTSAVQQIYQFVHAYGMESLQINGNDVEQVYQAVCYAAEYARSGKGPVYIEGVTYRIAGHMAGDLELIRTASQIEAQLPFEPVLVTRQKLLADGMDAVELQELETAVDQQIFDAIRFALTSPWPATSETYTDVFAP